MKSFFLCKLVPWYFVRFMKRIACLIALVGFCALIGKGWHLVKDGFSLNRTCSLGYNLKHRHSNATLIAEGKTAPWNLDDSILRQPYTYLGRGHQCYAFASADGKYVIKLPRYDRYRLSFFLRACPFSWLTSHRHAIRADIEQRLRFLLNSFHLAFEELQEETALLYLHLYRTDHFNFPLVLQDRLGRSHLLDPNQTSFIVQEKKPIMMSSFQQCLEKNRREEAKEILDAFLQVISKRAERGIYNKDPSFLRNFGLDKGKGFQIDIGSFYRKPALSLEEARKASFQETIHHVRNWLDDIDPEMLYTFDQKIQTIKQSWAD